MRELQPVNQNVLLDINESNELEKTASGIIIPDTAKEKKNFAKVLAISNVENTEIKVGDMVMYKKFAGNEVEFEGKKYLLIPYSDIMAKIVETESI